MSQPGDLDFFFLLVPDWMKGLHDLREFRERNTGRGKSMISAEDRMALRAFGCFRIHVRVAHPVRLDLVLAAVLSFGPIDEIHLTERRLDFRLFRVLLLHDVSVANSFAR